MALQEALKIISTAIDWWNGAKKWFKRKFNILRNREIRSGVDDDNLDDVDKWMRRVLKRKQDRNDSN